MLNRPLLKAGLAAGVLCLLALAVPAGAQEEQATTRTSFDFNFRANGDVVFSGRLKRIRGNSCHLNRKISLYRSRLSDGKTSKVAGTTSSKKSPFKWEVSDNRPGRYLVVVRANGDCKRAYRPTEGSYKFDPPNPAVPRD